MTGALTNLIATYGLLAILVLMAAESCGLPFPSEIIMPVGGLLVATGHLQFLPVVLAGGVGNLAGSLVAYVLAARFGEPLILGPGRRIGLSRAHLEMADRWFERWGLAAVFIGRLLPVVRTYISFPAGLARLRPVPFALLTLAGALPWCAALTGVGVALGTGYQRVSGPIQTAAIVIALLALAALAVWFVRGRREAARESASEHC
ncbi:MAG: DedA family protein [Candidatus Dormibacteraeota bacterium]|nr:DedA family protein [Candidatus Dormibacteraeota bacterium]